LFNVVSKSIGFVDSMTAKWDLVAA
jgi:hypothetical protein